MSGYKRYKKGKNIKGKIISSFPASSVEISIFHPGSSIPHKITIRPQKPTRIHQSE